MNIDYFFHRTMLRHLPILFTALFLMACMPRVSVNLTDSRPQDLSREQVAIVEVGDPVPENAEKLGELSVDDKRLFAYGDYPIVIGAAAEKVWESGGNVLQLTEKHKSPLITWNDRSRVAGNILFVPDLDSVKTSRMISTYQTNIPLEKRTFELSLGFSGPPMFTFENIAPATEQDLYIISARTAGVIALQGAWQFHKRWAVIASLGYSHMDIKYEDLYTEITRRQDNSEVFTSFAGMRYYYISRSAFKMYASAQCGLMLHSGGKDYWNGLYYPNRVGLQLTFIGIQFGKKWFGEIEFYGLGDYYATVFPGCGGRVGFGYRF